MTATSTAIQDTSARIQPPPARTRGRMRLLLAAIVVTELVSFGLALVSYLRPLGSDDGALSFDDVSGSRGYAWAFFLVAGVNVILAVSTVAIAILILAPARGARWATAGVAVMWLGSAVYGAGVSGWAVLYYFAGDRDVVGEATGQRLFGAIGHDTAHFMAVPLTGALLVGLGGFAATVGVWRARTVPRWVLLISVVATLGTFGAAPDTLAGTLAEALSSATTIAFGWFAWRIVVPDRTVSAR